VDVQTSDFPSTELGSVRLHDVANVLDWNHAQQQSFAHFLPFVCEFFAPNFLITKNLLIPKTQTNKFFGRAKMFKVFVHESLQTPNKFSGVQKYLRGMFEVSCTKVLQNPNKFLENVCASEADLQTKKSLDEFFVCFFC
jgi:hypothetical protein